MKTPKLALAVVAASAAMLAGCSAGSAGTSGSGSPAASGDAAAAGSDNAAMKICVYTHGDGGGFWSVAKKGAEQAAKDLGVTLDYQESNNDPQKQAQLIEAGVTGGCKALAVSAPNPDAIKDAMGKAKEAKPHLLDAVKDPEGQHIEIFDHLADIHWKLGEKAEAIAAWKKGLEHATDSKRDLKRVQEVKKKLKAAEGK